MGYLIPIAIAKATNPAGWVTLGHPPDKIEKLLDAKLYTVYVKTASGKIYSCYRESQFDTQCWVEVDQVPNLPDYRCDHLGSPWSPSPASSTTDRLDIEYCDRFDRYLFTYVLLSDGNVAQWTDYPWGKVTWQSLILSPCMAGGCLGLMGGIAIVVFLMRNSRRPQNQYEL